MGVAAAHGLEPECTLVLVTPCNRVCNSLRNSSDCSGFEWIAKSIGMPGRNASFRCRDRSNQKPSLGVHHRNVDHSETGDVISVYIGTPDHVGISAHVAPVQCTLHNPLAQENIV